MSSPTGQIIITGIIILAHPRPIDPQKGNRNVAFDVTIPVKDGNTSALGVLRYFTPENRVSELQKIWDNDFTQAFIVAKIASMPQKGVSPNLVEEEDAFEYAFVGDITEIMLTELHSDSIHHNPCIITSGTVDEFDTTKLTFILSPSQYINLTHTILDCRLLCFFDPESKKWQNKKPMPSTGSTVSVAGTLTKIKRTFKSRPTFEIEIDNIAYLNRSSGASSSTSHHPTTSSPASRHRFNYNITTESIPSPTSLGKRKKSDTDLNPEPSTENPKRSHTVISTEKKE